MIRRWRLVHVTGETAIHCREDLANGETRRWWEQEDGTSGLGGLSLNDFLPYAAERLPTNGDGGPVIVAEGEPATDALLKRGYKAVGTLGTSYDPVPEALRPLHGRDVVLWRDYSRAGRAHMEGIAGKLRGHVCPRWIFWGERYEDDAADFFKRDGNTEQLDSLLAEATAEPPPATEPETEDENPSEAEQDDLPSITALELDAMEIPERKIIIEPWLGDGEESVVYGAKGVGKTWVSQGTAAAGACGGEFLKWRAPESISTGFVDGEMGKRRLQTRGRTLRRTAGLIPGTSLHYITPDLPGGRFLNLANRDDQKRVEDKVAKHGIQLLVLDNIASLYKPGLKLSSNSQEWWDGIQNWLLTLRMKGVAIIVVLHAGKDEVKGPRGTSAILDIPEWSLSVSAHPDRKPSDPAWFIVKFEKTRDFLPEGDTFEAKLENEAWTTSGRQGRRDAEIRAAIKKQLAANPGIGFDQLRELVGVGRTDFARALKAMRDANPPEIKYTPVGKRILYDPA